MTLLESKPQTWVVVCRLADFVPGRGIAALVDGRAVALFLLDESDQLRAVSNVDPCSGASVLSRGLVGHTTIDGTAVTYVASPLRKQRFDLLTGTCLDADQAIDTWEVRTVDGMVEVGREPSSSSNGPETNP